MTLVRARVFDTPEDPFTGGRLRAESDVGLLVRDGVIAERAAYADLAARCPDEDVIDLREGLLLPGLIDTHVHYPQVRVIGGLGMPLLDWLDRCALPEEARLAEPGYAEEVAGEFVRGLASAGTTTALVFGSHFAPAVDALFREADRVGLRVRSGLVLGDRLLRPDLLTTPERAYRESVRLARSWHGHRRLSYAVTPRFSFSATDELLAAAAAVLDEVPGVGFTSHVNENLAEVAEVARLFPERSSYVDTYDAHGLLDAPGAVLAHDVHPTDPELAVLAARDCAVAHCPTSNGALGSGLFPMRRHLERGVRVALGSDVGAGTGFCLFKEGLQAYFGQQLLGAQGVSLTSTHLLYLATRAGALALGLDAEVGDLSPGRQFDAVWVIPRGGDPLAVGLRNAAGDEDALAKLFALATPADVAAVWVGGEAIRR